MNVSRDVLPLVFGLDMVGNKKGTKKQRQGVKSAPCVQDTSDTKISARMERSNTMQSNLQMHETLSGVLPSQAQMQLMGERRRHMMGERRGLSSSNG